MTHKMPAFHYETTQRASGRMNVHTVNRDRKDKDAKNSRDKKPERRGGWDQSRNRYDGKRRKMLDSHEGFDFDKEDVIP
ncbi:hypothetical protein PJO48_29570, partial [Mycobacterium kansasii]